MGNTLPYAEVDAFIYDTLGSGVNPSSEETLGSVVTLLEQLKFIGDDLKIIGSVTQQKVSDGSYGSITIGPTAVLILGSDNTRTSLQFQNLGPRAIYWGFDSSVTEDNGTQLRRRDVQILDDFTGDIYAITAAGSADVRWMEY